MEIQKNNSIFKEILGNSVRIKMIDFFIENHREAWNLVEIMNGSKIKAADELFE